MCRGSPRGHGLRQREHDPPLQGHGQDRAPAGFPFEAVLFGSSFLQNQDPIRLTETASGLVTVAEVASLVKKDLGSPRSPSELSEMVTATPDSKSDVISISAESPEAGEAADVANAFARDFIVYRQTTDKSLLDVAKQVLEKQIGSLNAADAALVLTRLR